MIDQPALFADPISVAEGERRRDAGMAKVLTPAEEWREAFERELVRQIFAGRERFTAEGVVDVIGLPPGHRNAIGAAMRSCALKLNLRNVGTVKAARVARHAGRVTVWERL